MCRVLSESLGTQVHIVERIQKILTMTRKSMMGLVRKERFKLQGRAFLVTWDVDSRDRRAVNRLQYFLFGRGSTNGGEEERQHGFVWQEGVRYIAQSAIYVRPANLEEIERLLDANGVDHAFESVVLS